MTLGFAASIPDVAAFLALEQMASEPYSSFVYVDGPQALLVAASLVEQSIGEFAAPFGQTLVDDTGTTVGILAGPLSRKELSRARLQAAQVIHKLGLFELNPGVAARGKLARETLFTLLEGDQYLSRIAVRPDARGRGVASVLLRSFLAMARERGGTRAVLEVSPSHTAAVRLYEKAGFIQVDERRVFDGETGRSLLYRHMVCRL